MEIRVSSGTAKNRKLKVPSIPGIKLAQEVVRQAIFAILSDKLKDSACLDLFAGSGSIGIEALSRGAATCDFVDINPEAAKTIEENLKYCGFEVSGKAYCQDALKFVSNSEKYYDIIFLDPYYGQLSLKHIFKLLPGALTKSGMAIYLHGKDVSVEELVSNSGLRLTDTRFFGATGISFMVAATVDIPT